jgi:hypothetical protein
MEMVNAEERMKQEEERITRLQAFAETLTEKRDAAKSARESSGCEENWHEDEEFYDGIDDLNRSEVRYQKSQTVGGRPTSNEANVSSNRCTVFVNITQPYTDMAVARASEMLFPNDDLPFGIDPTPMPDMLDAMKDQQTMITGPDGSQVPAAAVAGKIVEEAKTAAEGAQKQIWDWLAESGWHAEGRKLLEDAGKVGVSILKGPMPVRVKNKRMQTLPDGTTSIVIEEKTQPASKRISYWDFYPSGDCGENIQEGSGTWERDRITARQLREMRDMLDMDGNPRYLADQIDRVLKEGPNKKYVDERGTCADSEKFEIWYYTGVADADDLAAAGLEIEEGETANVIVTMVNDTVIKAALSTLESGEYPYDVMVWERIPGKWYGKGIPRKIRTAQRMLNAATRNMFDNAGISAGPILVIREGVLQPADGTWELTPRKIFTVANDEDAQKVQDCIHSIIVPSNQPELMNIIAKVEEWAEKITSMPLIMQGQQGAATETVGGMTMLQNNASAVLRRIAKLFDDMITVPHIGRYYEWLLLYGDDDAIKGDFRVIAHGSTALYERDAQNQAIIQMAPLVQNPAFGIDPKKWIVEAFKAQKLDPKRFQFTEEEIKQMEEAAKNAPPQDPQLMVAKMRADGEIQKAKMQAEAEAAKFQVEQEALRADREFKAQEAQRDRELDLQLKRMDYEMRLMEYAQKQQMQLSDVKKSLAETVIEIGAQKELTYAGMEQSERQANTPEVAEPDVEPVGRADDGSAFQQ